MKLTAKNVVCVVDEVPYYVRIMPLPHTNAAAISPFKRMMEYLIYNIDRPKDGLIGSICCVDNMVMWRADKPTWVVALDEAMAFSMLMLRYDVRLHNDRIHSTHLYRN